MVGQLARPQSEGERFLGALKESGPSLKESFQTAMKPGREEDENKRLKELTGKDYSGLSPDIKQLLLKGEMSRSKGKGGQDFSAANHALDQFDQMLGKEGLGWWGSKFNAGDEARFNRGKFEALQASLMPIFKGMFPRGMTEKEFKFINDHYIPQIGDTDEKKRGKIQGLRELIKNGDLNPQSMDLLSGQDMGMKEEGQEEDHVMVYRDKKGNAYDIPASVAKKNAAQLEAQGLTAE